MSFRSLTSSAVCLATFVVGSLGLNRGMILTFDGHGHVVVESAHVLHDRAHHEDGVDDHHHDSGGSPADSDHPELHEALSMRGEANTGSLEHRLDPAAVAAPLDAAVLTALSAVCDLRRSTTPTAIAEGHFWGSTARVELASINATVLQI